MTSLTLRAKSSRGPAIHDLADWERYAATKSKWADGFSAKELARRSATRGHAGSRPRESPGAVAG
jgi:hypothetical protein